MEFYYVFDKNFATIMQGCIACIQLQPSQGCVHLPLTYVATCQSLLLSTTAQ